MKNEKLRPGMLLRGHKLWGEKDKQLILLIAGPHEVVVHHRKKSQGRPRPYKAKFCPVDESLRDFEVGNRRPGWLVLSKNRLVWMNYEHIEGYKLIQKVQ